jgi:uncharacterized membrane protein
MTSQASVATGGAAARNIILVNYALLFASIFFAGIPGLIAVVIAYAQRRGAPPALRSHHQFQIRIFWIGFALTLAAGLCGLAALLLGIGALVEFTRVNGWDGMGPFHIDVSRLSLDGTVVGLSAAAAGFTLLSMFWLVAAPAFGAMRLASEQGMSQTPAS